MKYDVLTALQALGAHGASPENRLAVRLCFLITARYNWVSGSFSVGIQELARMWNITERSAIRDMVGMRKRGWITVSAPAARGRVARHRIEMVTVLKASMPYWDMVGPDFTARMAGGMPPGRPEGSGADNVVPLRPDQVSPGAIPEDDGTGWGPAVQRLMERDPNAWRNWFSHLTAPRIVGDILFLRAPTPFLARYIDANHHAQVLAAVIAANPAVRDVKFEKPSGNGPREGRPE